ncbi:MAG TPA: hypothetical protein VJA26_02635 [Gammaproteobacteria bacterium]|nr:hypothetical protein [Gammaproteobacteria bacterium]
MSAAMLIAKDREVTLGSDIEELLYQWGDDCRSTAEQLGMPATSGIARMIEQQRIFEGLRRGTRRKKPKQAREQITLRDGTTASICVCGLIYLEEHCPRCKGDPQPPAGLVHGTETRSFRPRSMAALRATTAAIEEVIVAAPGWARRSLMLSYLFRVRDSKGAQRLRIRTATYREQREAAVEYVAQRLGARIGK